MKQNKMLVKSLNSYYGKRVQGFTLIELMIVVAVIAILAAVAVPGYQEFVRKARRADGKEALLRLQIDQEKWRANNSTYNSILVGAGGLGWASSTSAEGHYTIAITEGSVSATGFTATATGKGSQASDSGCKILTLTVAAAGETKTPAACW